jgi:hypothetical protein
LIIIKIFRIWLLKPFPPTISIGTPEGLSVIRIINRLLDVAFERCYIVSSIQHPESFIEMEEWVRIPILPKHYPLTRPLVNRGHRTVCYKNRAITTLSSNAYLFEKLESLRQSDVNVTNL